MSHDKKFKWTKNEACVIYKFFFTSLSKPTTAVFYSKMTTLYPVKTKTYPFTGIGCKMCNASILACENGNGNYTFVKYLHSMDERSTIFACKFGHYMLVIRDRGVYPLYPLSECFYLFHKYYQNSEVVIKQNTEPIANSTQNKKPSEVKKPVAKKPKKPSPEEFWNTVVEMKNELIQIKQLTKQAQNSEQTQISEQTT